MSPLLGIKGDLFPHFCYIIKPTWRLSNLTMPSMGHSACGLVSTISAGASVGTERM